VQVRNTQTNNLVVAVLIVHAPNELFMNWTEQQKGDGIEFHLWALAIAVALMVRGRGALSVDHALSAPPEVRTTLRTSRVIGFIKRRVASNKISANVID